MNFNISISGMVYDIQRFALHDGPGIRTNVFLKGCPLRCLWCHAPESQSFDIEPDLSICKNIGKIVSVEDCLNTVRKDEKFYKQSGGGITISGGEPMSQFEFCKNLAMALKNEGYHVALDTSGYAPKELFTEIFPFIDLFLYDLKCIDNAKHKALTGVCNEVILENAITLAELGAHFQFRLPIIPTFNDSFEDMLKAVMFICDIRNINKEKGKGESIDLIQILPYHTLGENKYKKIGRPYELKISPPIDSFLSKLLSLFHSFGLNAQVG